MTNHREEQLRGAVGHVLQLDPRHVEVRWCDGRGAPVAHVGGQRYTDLGTGGAGPRGLYEIVDDGGGSFENLPVPMGPLRAAERI